MPESHWIVVKAALEENITLRKQVADLQAQLTLVNGPKPEVKK